MPFVEIKKVDENWAKITSIGISLPQSLRTHLPDQVKIYYDKEKKLIGLENCDAGYKFNNERLTCRKLLPEIYGKYYAEWDKEHKMVIVNLINKLED